MPSQADTPPAGWSDIQQDWESPLQGAAWGQGLDNRFLMKRLWNLPVEVVLEGNPGRVLDVASAGAVHSIHIASRGFPCVALEPAPTMIATARQRMAETGYEIELVRGFAETLPFRDESFDHVLCHSAIDHFAEPDRCIREMARVLRPDGRLCLTFVNYASLSTRLSRMYYRADALFRRHPRVPNWFWESPVPHEHSFECTIPAVTEMCEQYLTPDVAFGVSIGWQVPGWAWILNRLEPKRANGLLERLDAFALHHASLADVVVLVWRPRPRRSWRVKIPRSPVAPSDGAAMITVEPGLLRVTGADPVYRRLSRAEVEPKRGLVETEEFARVLEGYWRMGNRQIAGDPERSWIEDFVERRSPGRSAVLGTDGVVGLKKWQQANPGGPTEVFDLNPDVLRQIERALTELGLATGTRFLEADLNFLRLPPGSYCAIWTSGCLHHVINLEHLFDQIEQALVGDGLFAVYDYVGERRRRFGAYRLAKINALLKEIPTRFRRGSVVEITAPHRIDVGPLCSVRSDGIRSLLSERFEPVHEVSAGHFYPLELYLDIQRMEAEEPSWIDRLLEAEDAARKDPQHIACTLYGVYRKKGLG